MTYHQFYNIPTEASSLGKPLQEYNASEGVDIEKFGFGAVLVGIIMVIQLCRFASLGSGWFLFIVIIVGLFAAVLLFAYYRQKDWRILIFEDGFSHTLRGKTDIILWDDVEHVWQSITRSSAYGIAHISTAYIYTIELKDGRKYSLTNAFHSIEQLGKTVQKETFKRIYPKVMESLRNDEVVPFGDVGISQRGLHHGKSVLPWEGIKGIRINQGTISIKKDGNWLNWASITVKDTPNVYIFMTIVGQIVGVEV